jgi:hypothetical protein
MDEIDGDGLRRHDASAHPAQRAGLVAIGTFVVVIATWELYPGVRPLNTASPFFLFLILGAWSVGMPVLCGGLTGPAVRWTVAPGLIEIIQKRPFRPAKQDVFRPNQVECFDTRECPSMEGGSTWRVTMIGRDGRRFDTRDFGSSKTADTFRQRIESLFNS